MIRWSVKWELADAAMPAEIERLRVIHAGDPDFGTNPEPYLEAYARNKSLCFERRDQADDKIKSLKADPHVASIQLRYSAGEFNPIRWSWQRPTYDHAICFVSGLSRSNQDLNRCILARKPVGVSVHTSLTEPVRRLLVDYVNSGGRLFVDSGAFTTFTTGRDIDWASVMGRYKELFYRVDPARRSGLYLVAPDVVGDFEATADLHIATYGMFTFVMEDGGNIIVPCHRSPDGSIDPGAVDTWWPRDEFPDRFIIGLPYNKAAWSEDEVIDWMTRDLIDDKRIHLLGGGPSKVRSLVARADSLGLSYGSITGDAFHGTARDRKFKDTATMSRPRHSSARGHRSPKVTQASIRRAQATSAITPPHFNPNCQPGHNHNFRSYNSAIWNCTRCSLAIEKAEFPTLDSIPTMKFTTDEEEHASALTETPALRNTEVPAFSFRSYQREDIARAAMHDGAIIAWDPGLGKTMALFTFFMLKQARRVLIVAPAALHEQITGEGKKFFGIDVLPLPSQDIALDYMRRGILPFPGQTETPPDRNTETPAFFITAYNWLGYNQGDEWAAEDPNELIRRRRFVIAARIFACSPPEKPFARGEKNHWTILGLHEGSTPEKILAAWEHQIRLHDPALHPADDEIAWRAARINKAYRILSDIEDPEHDGTFLLQLAEVLKSPAQKAAIKFLREIETGIGLEKDGIRCCFKPTLCSLVKTTFDGIVCDEAVRLKSGTAYQADGVLRMESKYRLALTGTPIKNKLPDIFFLASFVTGHTARATARWPYGNGTADRAQFAQDFGVWEENLTKQEEARRSEKKSIPRGKTDPTRICNVHRLWRILGPVNIRRRKDDVPGCDIVGKTVVPVRIMPGTEQQQVYGFQLVNPPPHRSDLAELGHQLQCLRQSTLFPASRSLFRPGQPRAQSSQRFTPKSAGIMQLAIDLMAQGEQLVIFSPFQDFASDLADRFLSAGIPALNLDGKTDPLKRGALIKRFKSGEYPILIAGIESMGEGHSLDNASHLVLPSLSWAFDKNAQAVERVHRLTSKKDVTIYVMVTKNTIDERLVAMWQEKGDASDLALDGRLIETDREEIDLGQLLRDAVADFDPEASTIDEAEVELNWSSTLIPGLRRSLAAYRSLRPMEDQAPSRPANAPAPRPSAARPLTTTILTTTIPAIATLVPTTATPPPRSLFEFMKNKRTTDPTPAVAPTPAVEPAPPIVQAPVASIRNVIPFPGRLGGLVMPPKKPVAIPAALR